MVDLAVLVAAAEAVYSTRVAVSCGGATRTFREVGERSTRAANLLRGLHGAGPGNVVLLIGNRLEAVELDIALVKAGLGRVSLNPRLSNDERLYIVSNSDARIVVCSPDQSDFIEELRGTSGDILVLVLGEDARHPALSYERELARGSTQRPDCIAGPADPSLLMYTSGTTGRPKGAVWTFETRAAGVRNMLLNELDREASKAMVHVGSLSHGSGSKVLPVFLRGGTNVILEHFDPEMFFRVVAAEGGTATFVVPTMVQMMVDAAASADVAMPTMRHVAYGGAKMPLPTITAALERFGDMFVQVYGSCEAPHPMFMLDRDAHRRRDERILRTAGLPSIGVDVRIGDAAQLCEPGAEGEILISGPSVFAGYWGDPAATEAAFVDGYFRTGDVGRVHADGYVEVIDRIKDLIISGGYNVYPAEVERVLLEHPDVAQASVYGLPDEHWGETVAASVVVRAGSRADESTLAAFCADRLAGYKKPRRFAFVDDFPTGSTGKVLTAELKRRHVLTAERGAS